MRRGFLAVLLSLLPAGLSAQTRSEAEARKARSIAKLRAEGVPFIDHLPMIETEAESTRRGKDAVVDRAFALVIVSVKGETLDQDLTKQLIERFKAQSFFTPDELAFVQDLDASQHDRTQFVWRYEALAVILWSLGFMDDLPYPGQIVDVAGMVTVFNAYTTEGFREHARLRPQLEILDQADLIYRYHWAVREAGLHGQEAPAKLDRGVVMERHHALNWLIGAFDAPQWDDVPTDT